MLAEVETHKDPLHLQFTQQALFNIFQYISIYFELKVHVSYYQSYKYNVLYNFTVKTSIFIQFISFP